MKGDALLVLIACVKNAPLTLRGVYTMRYSQSGRSDTDTISGLGKLQINLSVVEEGHLPDATPGGLIVILTGDCDYAG